MKHSMKYQLGLSAIPILRKQGHLQHKWLVNHVVCETINSISNLTGKTNAIDTQTLSRIVKNWTKKDDNSYADMDDTTEVNGVGIYRFRFMNASK